MDAHLPTKIDLKEAFNLGSIDVRQKKKRKEKEITPSTIIAWGTKWKKYLYRTNIFEKYHQS